MSGRLDVRMAEVITFEQQTLAFFLGERIRKAIAKIETGSMPALAEIAISIAGDLRLIDGCWLDHNARFAKKIVESTARYRVTPTINHNGSFQITNGRDGAHFDQAHCLRHNECFRFI